MGVGVGGWEGGKWVSASCKGEEFHDIAHSARKQFHSYKLHNTSKMATNVAQDRKVHPSTSCHTQPITVKLDSHQLR